MENIKKAFLLIILARKVTRSPAWGASTGRRVLPGVLAKKHDERLKMCRS
jgi:hypothetical protein